MVGVPLEFLAFRLVRIKLLAIHQLRLRFSYRSTLALEGSCLRVPALVSPDDFCLPVGLFSLRAAV